MPEKLTKKQRRRATDQAILDAAIEEFAEKGFARSRVLNIAKKAGISQGLVSQNFGNKERLFMTATSVVDSAFFAPEVANLDVKELLSFIIDSWKKLYKDKPVHFKLLKMLTCSTDLPEIIEKGVEARFRLSPVYAAVEQAQAKGHFPSGDVQEIMWDLFKVAITLIYYFNKSGTEMPGNDFFLQLVSYKD